MAQGGAHILLVDDEAHVLHILGRALEAAGYRLTTCADGRQALECCRADRPDLIITDARMPEMNGVELAMALQRSRATWSIPLIVLTARGHTIDPDALQHTNVREVCSKPFSARAMVKLVGDVLAERRNALAQRGAGRTMRPWRAPSRP